MEPDDVTIVVRPMAYVPNQGIHVYIAYDLWKNAKVAEAIKTAVEVTFAAPPKYGDCVCSTVSGAYDCLRCGTKKWVVEEPE